MDVKVDRQKFEGVVRKLLATPPLPKAVVSRQIARKAHPKARATSPARPKSSQ